MARPRAGKGPRRWRTPGPLPPAGRARGCRSTSGTRRDLLTVVRRGLQEKNNLSPTIALYLYGRSFFLLDKAVAGQHKEAVDYWLGQARTHWLKLANRQSQASKQKQAAKKQPARREGVNSTLGNKKEASS